MGTTASFKEILRDKMEQNSSETSFFQSTTLDADPLHMAFLLGKINRLHGQPPLTKSQKAYPRPQPKARTPHSMNESQAQSFVFFKELIQDIPEGFTLAELKKAFRSAAKLLHPDHGGSSEQFFLLKGHYQNLAKILSVGHP